MEKIMIINRLKKLDYKILFVIIFGTAALLTALVYTNHKRVDKHVSAEKLTTSQDRAITPKHKNSDINDPEILISKLRRGEMRGIDLNSMQVSIVLKHIKATKKYHDNSPENIALLHEINRGYQKSSQGKTELEYCLKNYGDNLASPEIHEIVHMYLELGNCPNPTAVSVYYLDKDHFASAITTPFGIWIRPIEDAPMLRQVCAHEGGHWKLQHHHKKYMTEARREFEADEIAFNILDVADRNAVVARSMRGLDRMPTDQAEKERYKKCLSKDYICPGPDHAENFLTLAEQSPHLLAA